MLIVYFSEDINFIIWETIDDVTDFLPVINGIPKLIKIPFRIINGILVSIAEGKIDLFIFFEVSKRSYKRVSVVELKFMANIN